MKPNIDYTLYLCTDRNIMSCKTIEESVEKAILGGVSIVQLREKNTNTKEFFELAKRVHLITKKFNIPLVINDRIDIAIAINAEGIHIGQNDMPLKITRKIIGNEKIIGVSASNYNEAKKAVIEGADYLGIGAMFRTNTKTDAIITPFKELKKIRKDFSIPLIVIGGINEYTIPEFAPYNIDGYAVISAIISKKDITLAAKNIKKLIEQNKQIMQHY